MTTKISLTPSWKFAVNVYCNTLENPRSSPKARKLAREDLMRLADLQDEHNKPITNKAKGG